MTTTFSKETITKKRSNISDDDIQENNMDTATLNKAKKKKLQMTMAEYDMFLIEKKNGSFKRTGNWAGLYKRVAHECCDPECARKWAPTPEQCLSDDYYCPSCVLHHRNNVNRFAEERLKWTANVPNTFYVFSLVDPGKQANCKMKRSLIKFGRTQNINALKRYRTSELKQYEMKLLLSIRGKLITMTQIENWWKQQAEEKKWFVRFSREDFHGQTECIEIDEHELAQMITKSKEMAVTNAEEEDTQY